MSEKDNENISKSESLIESMEDLDKKVKGLTKEVSFMTFKKELEQVVAFTVNKAMIKKISHNWQIVLIIIGLVTFYMVFTQYNFNKIDTKIANLTSRESGDPKVSRDPGSITKSVSAKPSRYPASVGL